MNDSITINDIDYTTDVEGLDKVSITVALNTSNKTIEQSVSGDLTFKGRAYDLISNTFFQGCEGKTKTLTGVLYMDDICTSMDFVIRHDQVTEDPCKCEAVVRLKRETEETECYRYLNSKAFWQNGFINAFTHPKIHYCSQPGFLHYIFLFLLLPVICPILIIIELIEEIINIIPFVPNVDLPSVDNIDELVLGCGKKHVAPYLKEVFNYHTGKCGLTFQSSILLSNSAYSNTAMLLAQNERGYTGNANNFNWIDENRWNVSPIQILEKISLVHNGDFRIKNGKLIYERKDYFLTDFAPSQISLVDLCTNGDIDSLEYQIIKGKDKAYGKFEYQADATDTEGNRLLDTYNDIVEWNDPVKEYLSGEHLVQLEFSAARFMFDRETQEKDSVFDYDRRIDVPRKNGGQIGGIVPCPIVVSNKRDRDLILENNTSSNIKLLALEAGTPRNDARTVRRKRGNQDGFDFWDYNYPYYFDAKYTAPELYQNFHFIDDPNLPYGAYYQISNQVTIPLTKEYAQAILTDGIDIRIVSHKGDGKAERYEINREGKEIVISGIQIPCE